MILASAAALGLLAAFRPHPALAALAVAVPCANGLRLISQDEAALFVAATAAGALIAAARPRKTALRAQRPDLMVPATGLAAAIAVIAGLVASAPILEGLVLSVVTARHARDGVMRPVHLIASAVVGGLVIFVIGRPPGSGGMDAVALWSSRPAAILAVAALLWTVTAVGRRLGRGFAANPGDRMLAGALAAFVLSLAWMITHPSGRPELPFPFWILLGAMIARADGDAQPPLADMA